MPASPQIQVLLVEDHRGFREGLTALIDGAAGFACCGACSSMEQALSYSPSTQPDLALVDIDLPGISGIDGIGRLKERWPSIYPLILTVHDDDQRILKALCAGADGSFIEGNGAGSFTGVFERS